MSMHRTFHRFLLGFFFEFFITPARVYRPTPAGSEAAWRGREGIGVRYQAYDNYEYRQYQVRVGPEDLAVAAPLVVRTLLTSPYCAMFSILCVCCAYKYVP